MKQLSNVEIGKMRQLADFLETVPPADFDLTSWQTQAPIQRIAFGPIVFRHGCGFSGCAMGWAAYAEIFPDLYIDRTQELCYRGATNMNAAAKLLGVTESIANFFFVDSEYVDEPSPDDVSKRLRRFADKVERRLMRRQSPELRVVA